MNGWMILWTALLGITAVSFLGLVIVVGIGAIGELRETLDDLRDGPNVER